MTPRPPITHASRLGRGIGLAALLLGVGGCESAQPLLDPRGPVAEAIAELGITSFVIAGVVALFVFGMLLYPVLRAWRGREEPLSLPMRPVTFVLVAGVAVPALILGGIYFYALGTLSATTDPPSPPVLRVEITGHQWWWEVRYLTPDSTYLVETANEIHIPAGVPVRFDVRTADVIHSFWVPQLGRKIDLIPGRVNTIWLQADKPGVFRGQCAEYCGAQHAHMGLFVMAQPPAEFNSWLARQQEPASVPTDSLALRGRDVFLAAPCAFCHTVRGTPAQGGVAPDLTHLGSRSTIAAGLLKNTQGNLEAWIVDSQHLKPGVKMPAYNLFRGEELRALAAYLQSLK
jgi:cytochrome c oxidase subunit 2